MAEAVVGGAFLSAFLNVVFDKLASPEVVNFIRGKKLDSDLIGRLETILIAVTVVLNDAEKKQFRDSGVNNWLNRLKDAVYVADDLLDEIFTKAVTQKEEVSYNLFSRLFNLQDREMVSNLEDIVERLESVLELKESLDLKEIAVENLPHRTPSTCLQDESHVYGRGKDKEAIIKLLLDDNNGGEEVSVIPIVGMGGVGKTTLARLVYNDESLKNIFNLKAWVCVSEEFDILKVTKIITQAVTGKTCEMNDMNLLHLGLQDMLKEKKFLIVLDDVWIEDYVNWDDLKKPFQRGVTGSKILVTTRSEKVASVVQTVQTYNLNQLSNEDCWLVFANHACFSPRSSGNTTDLEKIGREIVKKCAGLPLAAQSLGGILRRKHNIRDWNNLLKSDIWELSESESKIIPSLRVSYHYLPPHLKRCFVYCSLYPKDYEFEKDDLILLWMAEDLLSPPRNGKTLEQVGGEYLDYLVARSFLQRSSETWKVSFVMHDLLHDLAIFLGGEFYLRSEDPELETKISIKTRHLSFTKFSGLLENIEVLGTTKFLRTFLPMSSVFDQFNDDGKAAACIVLSKLKHLRVLSFCRFSGLDALPDSIGELIHLRYLDLSWTSIMALPESLGSLCNLQTLKLSGCDKLNVLPNSMSNLVNLLYLDLSTTSILVLPESLGNLYNLQTLKLSACHKLNVLPNSMPNLPNLLYLDLSWTSIMALPESLGSLCNLQTLILSHCDKLNVLPNSMPNLVNLLYLNLSWTSIMALPESLGSLCNLQTLILSHCDKLNVLPNSMPNLVNLLYLDLSGTSILVLPESLGNLYNLQALNLSGCDKLNVLPNSMPNLVNLLYLDLSGTSILVLPESLGNLYNLETLKLSGCDKLNVLPNIMPNLVNLLNLDIAKTALEEMPQGMGKLTQLQHLSDYIVGKHEENGIKELGGLSNLHGSVSIRELENVSNGSEALGAKMRDKKHISQLSLTWSSTDNCFDSQTEIDILCKLQPHQDLQLLEIDGYRGTRFPDWVRNSSFHNMTDIKLSSCKNCDMLPSLGQLPSLKKLSISNLDALVTIDAGFYRNNDSSESLLTPFPFLESLRFYNMPCWEMWSSTEPYAFPKLKRLTVINCKKLRDLPSHLPALEELSIVSCRELASSLPRVPAIRRLRVIESNKVPLQELPLSIETLNISVEPLDWSLSIPDDFDSVRSASAGTWPSFVHCYLSCLESLSVSQDCDLPTALRNPPSMTYIVVSHCKKLNSLSQQMNTLLPKIEHLHIENCPEIESFPQVPPSLRSIKIINCDKLLSGWPSMDMLTDVTIGGSYDGVKSFPMEGLLPSSVTHLFLYDFSSLETLDCKGLLHLPSLQTLTIACCPKLENIAGERLPASLTKLTVNLCPLLKERCCQKHPQIWPKISHVHHIQVDWEPIS